jgi:carboxymethylenebutenolidase
LQAPVLGLYAGKDAGIPLDGVAAMRAALSAPGASSAAVGSQIIVYPEAGHGFHADYRASYRREDAEAAFAQAIGFFAGRGLTLKAA